MMRLRIVLLISLLTLSVPGWTTADQSPKQAVKHPHELFLGTLWMKTSGEYYALTTQTYRIARLRLDEALRDPEWTADPEQKNPYLLPPAVIMDLDETVLDNSAFEIEMIESDTQFTPAMWTKWVNQSNAKAVPGALDFIKYAETRGVRIFYITNRRSYEEMATRINLKKLGISLSDTEDEILTRGERPEWRADKEKRRQLVAKQYRILLYIGDNMGDFLSGGHTTPQARVKLAIEHEDRWGKQWILLPNPIYGTWAQSLYGFDYELSYADKLKEEYQYLQEHK
jgi:5'-nucleotidase (lipoprotein e(P4) family)